MGLISRNTFGLSPLRVKAGGTERRRAPRFEAIGPGELLSMRGEPIARFRLVDEGHEGLGCLTPEKINVGEMVHVRVGAEERWRTAVVVNQTAFGSLHRLGLSFAKAKPQAQVRVKAA